MSITPGIRLGHYTIQDPLGAVGTRVVYSAHDTRLEPRVAIKVLPPELCCDELESRVSVP